jgi:hypothetical protein
MILINDALVVFANLFRYYILVHVCVCVCVFVCCVCIRIHIDMHL